MIGASPERGSEPAGGHLLWRLSNKMVIPAGSSAENATCGLHQMSHNAPLTRVTTPTGEALGHCARLWTRPAGHHDRTNSAGLNLVIHQCMSEANETAEGTRGARVGQSGSKPSLSIVVLSTGTESDLERAMAYVSGVTRRLGAELIVVRGEDDKRAQERLAVVASARRFHLCMAEPGTSRAGLADLGMRAASGDVVAVREDSACLDGDWLRPFAERLAVGLDAPHTVDDVRVAVRPQVSTRRRWEATSEAVI